MSTVNKVILVGNLGHTPELKHTEKGTAYVRLSIATSRKFRTAEGAEREETTWHRATAWGKQAENCAKFLAVCHRVYVSGELRIKIWEDKQGQKRNGHEIDVEEVRFLGGPLRSDKSGAVSEPAEAAVALAN
jgi:single-strand DNA-binding protein